MDLYFDTIDAQNVENDPTDAKIKDIIERINILLDAYCKEQNLEDLRKESQAVFYGGLMFVCFNLFDTDKSILYKYTQGVSNNGCITQMYDDDILLGVGRYFIYLCTTLNKIPNPTGFSYLTGVDLDTLARWGKSESQRPKAYGLVKMLKSAYESGLESGAQFGKNPVGFIATLNHRFNWANDNKTAVTVNITKTNEQLMSTVDASLLEEIPTKSP